MTWSYGYTTNLHYTFGYYKELNPTLLKLVCLCAGIVPQISENPAYLELGFGQGVSVNIHAAAAASGTFWGTDFNPAQTLHARTLVQASGAELNLFNDSFEEFAARADLPDFDFIVLHGIWSWISDGNRKTIVDIIRRKLRVGGLVYVSYNCLPGWGAAFPVRQLLKLNSDYSGQGISGPRGAVEEAVRFTQDILKAGSLFFRENPWAAHRADKLLRDNPNYIAHEYMNDDWHLCHFSDMARALDDAKLSYVGPARLLDGFDAMHVTPDGRKLLETIGHPILRETVRDYFVNRMFRCDVFVKGRRSITGPQQNEMWRTLSFVLIACQEDVPKTIPSTLGEIVLPAKVYDPLIDALAGDGYRPKRLDELMANSELDGLKITQVVEALVILIGSGFVAPAQVPTIETRNRCRKFNAHVRQRALAGRELLYLASPITGGGITVPHVCLLFLQAIDAGKTGATELAEFASSFYERVGERLVRDGKPIESPEEKLKAHNAMAQRFLSRMLPLFSAIGVIEHSSSASMVRRNAASFSQSR